MEKVRVLLADDHAIVRAGIRKVVEEIPGIEVVEEVGDGLALIESLGRNSIDLLIIDVMMPDFDPIPAIKKIRAGYPQLIILVVSAHDNVAYVQGFLSAGVNGYHLKDQSLSDMKLAIERVLTGELWVSSPLISKLVRSPSNGGSITNLTIRQKDILRLLQGGYDNQAIAHELGVSVKTVENHLTRLYKQIKVQSRLEAVNFINQHPALFGTNSTTMKTIETDPGYQMGITILLVDDNQHYLSQLTRALGKVSPQAVLYEAESIVTAVQLARQVLPRLVFVDVVLGEEDGIHCTRRIKAVSPISRIITISAYPDREFHRLSLEAGAIAFLDKKDLDAVTLRQVIEDLN